MDFREVLKTVEGSKEYEGFIKEHPKSYLVHIFTIMTEGKHDFWHIGYYLKDIDRIVVLEFTDPDVRVHPPAEALKGDEGIDSLDLASVKIGMDRAEEIVKDFIKKNTPADIIQKKMFLLQNLKDHGQIWNVTIITMAFNVFNVKIDANSGEILKHSKENLMMWKKDETKEE